ncbi:MULTISPECIES: hypothetical protein [Streptomyces]|uniref:hypothetical protein n=1 Tax=Streptomyces TaxID=1883 RepID=UPI00167A00A8|nr:MULTISPECIES: hypothetical protein [Streptomyces]MBD3576146.1 hypothetical protein [Streptomyces sp. KD18]GGS97416.1 hypothetical protein GCM10010286_22960 [Streptomyces toxytricini]
MRVGDHTLGYNPSSGVSEWTAIEQVREFPAAEVWKIGNQSWQAEVTAGLPWWSEARRRIPVPGDVLCMVCGRDFTSPRGYQVHMTKAHGAARAAAGFHYVGEFVRAADFTGDMRLRVSAPLESQSVLQLSSADVRILAWLWGDGNLREAERPGAFDGSIFQSKEEHVGKLRSLLREVPHTEFSRQRKEGHLRAYHFRLRRAFVTDLVERSGIAESTPEMFVLRLSRQQREAWLDAMIDAEGHRMKGKESH